MVASVLYSSGIVCQASGGILELRIRNRTLCVKTIADAVELRARVSVHVPREKIIVFPGK